MRIQLHQRTIGIAAILCAMVSVARAAPLADRVPADALLYVGWAGSQALHPAYDASNLRQVLDQSGLPELLRDSLPRVIQRATAHNPQAAENLAAVMAAAGPLWRHPTALYVGPVDFSTSPPTVHLALLCDAGDEAADLSEQWNKLLASAPSIGPPLVNKTYGNLVVLSVGMIDADVDAAFAKPPAASLAIAAPFTAAQQQVQADAPLVAYADLPALVKLGDGLAPLVSQQSRNPQIEQVWPTLRDTLNLGGLRQAMLTAGFDGKDWASQAFVGTDGSQRGITAALGAGPLDDALLAAAPQSCTRFAAGRFDLNGLFNGIRWAIGAFKPEAAQQFDQAMTRLNLLAGLDLQHDLLESLGDQWAGYSDRTIGGSGFFGGVVVNRLHDPARLDSALQQLSQRANLILARQAQQSPLRVQFLEQRHGNLTVHYLGLPFVAPAWAVKDGNLYLALYPQVAEAAAEFVGSGRPAITQNPQYAALIHRLGDHKPASVSFLDLPQTAPESYGDVLALSQLYIGFAEMAGATTGTTVLPPLDKLLPVLSPAGAVSWADSAGWHSRSISPFPASEVLGASGSGSSIMIGQTALMTSILLPALNRARETANRVKSASNERQIGQAILLYSNDNRGKYPPDLGTLVMTEDIGPQMFLSPLSPTHLPPNIATLTPAQQADWVNHNSDYIYVGQGLTNSAPPTRVVVYEKDSAHGPDGMNILFGDGHVAFVNPASARQLIQNATGGGASGPAGDGGVGGGQPEMSPP